MSGVCPGRCERAGGTCNRQTCEVANAVGQRGPLERDEIRWGRDDGPFFFSCPGRKPHERCEPGPILLCMGLFSRFCVWAPRRGFFVSSNPGQADQCDDTPTVVPTETRW